MQGESYGPNFGCGIDCEWVSEFTDTSTIFLKSPTKKYLHYDLIVVMPEGVIDGGGDDGVDAREGGVQQRHADPVHNLGFQAFVG